MIIMPRARVSLSPPVNVVLPVISGLILQGGDLHATPGTWTNSPFAYAYQWQADGVDLGGATTSTYRLTSSEVGKVITVEVTATNSAGSAMAESLPTEPILAALLWYDPSDLSTLFQDAPSGGTPPVVPVTADGQLVRTMYDKSDSANSGMGTHAAVNNGIPAGCPVYRTDGVQHWLEYKASDVRIMSMVFTSMAIQQDMADITGLTRPTTGTFSGSLFSILTPPFSCLWHTDNKFYAGLGGSHDGGSGTDGSTGTFVISSRRDASVQESRKNKVTVKSSAAPTVTGAPFRVGGTVFDYMNSKLFGVIVIPAHTTAQLESIETWMGTQSGIVI